MNHTLRGIRNNYSSSSRMRGVRGWRGSSVGAVRQQV
jgi:hypothetical protein